MARTYEEIEKDILKIRKDLVEGIQEALETKGYGVDDTVYGENVSVKVDRYWNHNTLVCDNRLDGDTFYHVDSCGLDTILEAYRTVLTACPKL